RRLRAGTERSQVVEYIMRDTAALRAEADRLGPLFTPLEPVRVWKVHAEHDLHDPVSDRQRDAIHPLQTARQQTAAAPTRGLVSVQIGRLERERAFTRGQDDAASSR